MKLICMKMMNPLLKIFPTKYDKKPQTYHVTNSRLAEIQHHHFDDSHLSHCILTNLKTTPSVKSDNDSAFFTETSRSNPIIQTPIKSTSTNSLPFVDPSFLAHCKASEKFFLPSDTILTTIILLQAQRYDHVLSTV